MTVKHAALALCCLLALGSASAQQVRVSKSRPRMLVTKASLQALRKRAQKQDRAWLAEMKRRCDGMIRTPARLDNNGRHYLPSFALLYLITQEEKYADKAAEWLELLSQKTIQNEWTCLEYIPTASFAFDWIHPTLSLEQRDRFAGGLLRQVTRIQKLWRHSDYNNHFLLEHMSTLHVALTLAHEPTHQKAQKRLMDECQQWLMNHVIPAANEMAGNDPETAGGQAEGFSYNNWGYARPLAIQLAAWKSATGQNLFTRCTALQFDALWNIHGQRPDGRQNRSEDSGSRLRWGQMDAARFFLEAREYRDGYAQTAALSVTRRYPQLIWAALLFHDPSVRARAFKTLPLARRFEPLGLLYSRSDWGPDAFYASFQCGDFFAGHQHLDNNAFTIFHHSPLAIDSGVNEYSSHRAHYYSRTIAHNSIVVVDPEEEFPSGVWSSTGKGGSNDGGQRRVAFPTRVTAKKKAKLVRDIGSLIHFENQKAWCYAIGDATASYSQKKLRLFRRHFVHLRPNMVVIFDEVETTRAGLPATWVLHSLQQPSIDDDLYHIPGGLQVQRIAPSDARVRVVGGPGREFQVGGKNYPPDSKKDPESGSWRLEVEAKKGGKQQFLHILWTQDPKPGPAPKVDWNPGTRQLRIQGKAILDFRKRKVRILGR